MVPGASTDWPDLIEAADKAIGALYELTSEDVEFLRGIVERHVEETDSARGREILGGWAQNVNHFAKVMPRDYKRVLLAIEQAEKDGRNVDEAIMEAANG